MILVARSNSLRRYAGSDLQISLPSHCRQLRQRETDLGFLLSANWYSRTALALPVLGTRRAKSHISLQREWLKGKYSTKRQSMAWQYCDSLLFRACRQDSHLQNFSCTEKPSSEMRNSSRVGTFEDMADLLQFQIKGRVICVSWRVVGMEEESGYQQVQREEERQAEMKHHEETINQEEHQQEHSENAPHDEHPIEANQAEKTVPSQEPAQHEQGRPIENNPNEQVPDEMTYDAGSLRVIFKRRQFSLKITVIVTQGGQQQAQSFQDLLTAKKDECFSVVITRANMSVFLKKHFKNPGNLHAFIVRNLKKEHILTISKDQIRLVIATGSQQPKSAKIDIKALREQRYKYEMPNMDKMQDRLLQFSNEELQFIDKYYLISEGQEEPQEVDSEILQWLQLHHESDDEEIFIEKWAPEAFQEEEDDIDMAEIEKQEKELQEFQKKFPIFKKTPASYATSQPVIHKQHDQKPNQTSSSPAALKDSVFPPGYIPPHLAKQTASDGLTSDQALRFQSNQSKKEKLKIAKQLLKQGYSTAEVIQRLQAMEKSAKSSTTYVDPNPQQSQKSTIIKPPSAPSVTPAQSKEKAVREMLISLIRAKTYKKLEDIHKHMTNAGLQTTMTDLKRIIDEIKAKTAQRKAKQGKE